MYNISSFDIIKSLLLLFLGVSSNFVAETLGCKTQNLFSNNMFAKQGIILLILYFSLTFVSGTTNVHPGVNLLFTLFVWVMYLLFTKMNLEFTVCTISLVAVNYVLYTYIRYYKKNGKKKELVDKLESSYTMINKSIVALIIIGFVLYLKKQYIEHADNWSTATFMFGKVQCDSMK